MTWWWQTLISVAAALLLAWIGLLIALLIAHPGKAQLKDALRLLPDLLRLLRRLAADPTPSATTGLAPTTASPHSAASPG